LTHNIPEYHILNLAVTMVLHLQIALQALHEEEQDPDAGTVCRNVTAVDSSILAVFKWCTRLGIDLQQIQSGLPNSIYYCINWVLRATMLPIWHQLMIPAMLVMSFACKAVHTVYAVWPMFDLLQPFSSKLHSYEPRVTWMMP
jgi:hypothetical protein